MTNIPATHDPRTDAQILEDKDKNKDLERGTVRDANGVPRDMRQFPAAPVESYSQYLARVSGLTDFTPLTEAQWRKETGQLTVEEQILTDLGIAPRPVIEAAVPLNIPILDGTVETFPDVKEVDIAQFLNVGVDEGD
jgi:prophage DNA circulation protein